MPCDLAEIRKQLEDLQRRMDDLEKPTIGKLPHYPDIEGYKVCSKCGISLENSMCYSCPNADCPCGMGPSTC